MGNWFWQAKTVENHLSNLLKKHMEPEIAALASPLSPPWGNGKRAFNTDMQSAEPAMSSEQLFRTKLLELERQTQEIEKEAYGKGFAQGEKDGFDYGHKAAQVIKAQLSALQNMEALPGEGIAGLPGMADRDQHQDSGAYHQQGGPNLTRNCGRYRESPSRRSRRTQHPYRLSEPQRP